MDMQFATKKEQIAVIVGICIAIATILFAVIVKYGGDSIFRNSPYNNFIKKKKIISQVRIDLLKTVEMEKYAVMAITDRESIDFANQSRAAWAEAEYDLNILRSLVDTISSQDEQKLMGELSTCWTELGKLDQVILELAVENSNFKAAALSREQGAEMIQRFEQTLEPLLQLSPGAPNEVRVTELVSRALIAGLKMYNLHSAHINEAADWKMDQIEAQMRVEESKVADSFADLVDILGPANLEAVSQAQTAFAEFVAVTAKVLNLSRKNNNIKSVELSLGKKRLITAQCDTILVSFQETLQNKKYKEPFAK